MIVLLEYIWIYLYSNVICLSEHFSANLGHFCSHNCDYHDIIYSMIFGYQAFILYITNTCTVMHIGHHKMCMHYILV